MHRHQKNRIVGKFLESQRGNITILTALCMPAVIAAGALAVDLGSLYLERREAQGVADLAAIAAASDLDEAEKAVSRTLAANGTERIGRVEVTRGHYTPDPSLSHEKRFTAGISPYNAVEVTTTKTGATFFARSLGAFDPQIRVRALGISSAEATFSLGSRLLSVRDGIPNKILGAFLGGNVSLSVMDYRALLDANVQLGAFMQALAADMHITAGTYNDVLSSHANVGNVIRASAAVLKGSNGASGAAALDALLMQSAADSIALPLKSLIDLGSLGALAIGQQNAGLGAMLNVLDLVNASAALANANHQVAIDLGAAVPGVLSLKIDLTVGERAQQSPWVRVGQAGSVLRTAQTRLRLVAEIGGSGPLAGVKVRLPVALDLAYAEAKLQGISCTAGAQSSTVDIAVRPGVARAWIGEPTQQSLTNLAAEPTVGPAVIVSANGLEIRGRAFVMAGNIEPTTVQFNSTEISAGVVKTVESNQLTESLVTSLLGQLTLEAKVGGLSLLTPQILKNSLAPILASVAKPLDETVAKILMTLGIHAGEADVRINGVRCGAATLAG